MPSHAPPPAACRVPADILPGALAACKAVWQAALAVPAPAVRVKQQDGTPAAEYERQFGPYAAGVRALHLSGDGLPVARCLQLACPDLRSLSIKGPEPRQWLQELPRFRALERLSVSSASFSLSSEEAAVLGRLPLRRLLLDLDWPEDDNELPAMPQLEVLRVACTADVDAYTPALPDSYAWLGSGRLEQLVLRSVALPAAPPPPVLTSLVSLELSKVSCRPHLAPAA